MIDIIQHNGNSYPAFQATGNAARFCMPFAEAILKGLIMDIGCNRKEWAYPNAMMIDPVINPEHDAMNLPVITVDGIFSSHCLEHLPDWVGALDHWAERIRRFGILFLYLPHPEQSYWAPWHNRKHIHSLHPEVIREYLIDRGWNKVFVSGRDLNHSFIAIAEKP